MGFLHELQLFRPNRLLWINYFFSQVLISVSWGLSCPDCPGVLAALHFCRIICSKKAVFWAFLLTSEKVGVLSGTASVAEVTHCVLLGTHPACASGHGPFHCSTLCQSENLWWIPHLSSGIKMVLQYMKQRCTCFTVSLAKLNGEESFVQISPK